MSQAECQAQRLPVEYREHLLPPRCRCCKHLRAAASPASFQLVAMASDPGARGVGNREVTVTAKVGCDAGQAPAATVGPVMAENGASHPAADDAAGMPSAARHMPPCLPTRPQSCRSCPCMEPARAAGCRSCREPHLAAEPDESGRNCWWPTRAAMMPVAVAAASCSADRARPRFEGQPLAGTRQIHRRTDRRHRGSAHPQRWPVHTPWRT
mmetsp:Transcript_40391/g.98007  ORF Transcript_40391/g.98007 Transcript_40391/m.98007 type:complete len:211 (-) Transcript_40391:624-1256(-)